MKLFTAMIRWMKGHRPSVGASDAEPPHVNVPNAEQLELIERLRRSADRLQAEYDVLYRRPRDHNNGLPRSSH
jgi:hypothetical protein